LRLLLALADGCETIPDRPGVVGNGSVVLLFTKTASAKRNGSARQTFTVQ
jgi:hypothetical protein